MKMNDLYTKIAIVRKHLTYMQKNTWSYVHWESVLDKLKEKYERSVSLEK